MIKKFAIFLTIFSLFLPTAHAAVSYDEQWRQPTWSSPTDHIITIESAIPLLNTTSHLWAEYGWPDGKFARYICTSTSQLNCANPSHYSYTAVFPVCSDKFQKDCIEEFSDVSDPAKPVLADFARYTLNSHPNNFEADKKLGLMENSNPSLWSLESAPHVSGTSYVLSIGVEGGKSLDNPLDSYEYLFGYIVPVESHPNALTKIGACTQNPNASIGAPLVIANTECAGAAEFYTSPEVPRCYFANGANGDCFSPVPFPENRRFSVTLRLSKEPIGWLHGRITDPEVSIDANSEVTRLRIGARPVTVPTFHIANSWSKLGSVSKSWWLEDFPICNQTIDCQQAGGLHSSDPRIDTENSFVGVTILPSGDGAINAIKKLSGEVQDRAIVAPTAWSFRTLSTREMAGSVRCLTSGKGLKGIVSTNSTAYSSGPPVFKDAILNYKVASLHYLPNQQIFKGTYDLIMRSDVARCLYGFSNAGISASISVINADGNNEVATTTSGERNGWLHLSARNFTFSSPTIRVKLSQPDSVKSIQCTKGKTSKTVSGKNPKCPTGFKLKK